ncbi:hypothetical protein K469DRAFT_584552, partial [Zopfia rhizophila CBS 207.26]
IGVRKKRLMLLVISILIFSVQTAWRARPGCVVLILSLDLARAFNNVSHERLLYILRKKRLLEWIVYFI